MALPLSSETIEFGIGGVPIVQSQGLNTLQASNLAGLLVDTSGNITAPGTLAVTGITTFTGGVVVNGAVTENAEIVTATNVILANESGKTFYLSAAGGFTSTLPAAALGLYFNFVVKTAPTAVGYLIGTDSGANVLYGMFEERAGTAGVAGAAQDLITLVANQSIIADEFTVRSDGTNWYVHGMVNVAAGVTFAVT